VVCACYCYDWGFMFGEMEMRTGGRGAVVRLAGGQAGEVGFGSGFWVKVGIIYNKGTKYGWRLEHEKKGKSGNVRNLRTLESKKGTVR
jgi:hypothetical protein